MAVRRPSFDSLAALGPFPLRMGCPSLLRFICDGQRDLSILLYVVGFLEANLRRSLHLLALKTKEYSTPSNNVCQTVVPAATGSKFYIF